MNAPQRPPHDPYAGPPPAGYGTGAPQGGLMVYRAPAPSSVPEGARPSSGLLSFHLISSIAPLIGFLIGGILLGIGIAGVEFGEPLGALFFAGAAVMGLGCFGWMIASILKMVWFYQIWSWIPPSHRVTKNWSGGMTPAFAALGHLIPYFNIFWAFAATFATCDAMEALSAQYTPGRMAPRGAGTAMAICSIIMFPVAPFFMHSVMKDIGRMAEQIDLERSRTGSLGPGFSSF